jgi:NAD(P)-dependent dehydrogenase (short-subunit alcohol dehydrogenase family)
MPEEGTLGLLERKAIVITGAGRGLGRGYALEAARQGACVVVNDVDAPLAESVAAEIVAGGGRAVAHTDSIATWDGAAALIALSLDAFGRLDGLVNNAGIQHAGPSLETDETSIRAIFEVNVLGAIFVGTHAMRAMVGQGQGGTIVNNGSSSQMGVPDLAAYSATKGALATLTYSWAIDMRPYGIRVNAFAPSAFTRMSEASGNPISLQAPPIERNVPAMIYLLSPAAEGITGQIIQLNVRSLHIVAHPTLTDAAVTTADEWTPAEVIERFDPVLRANLQDVGWGPSLVVTDASVADGA